MTRNFEAIPIKDITKVDRDKSYFAIIKLADHEFPVIVKYNGTWWLNVLTNTKQYGITHILIET